MLNFPIYKPNAAASIYCRIHDPASNEAYDFTTETMKAAVATSKANTTITLTWDAVLMKYVLTIPESLPVGKSYDIVAYKDSNQTEVHLGRRVFLHKTMGFIACEGNSLPSWI